MTDILHDIRRRMALMRLLLLAVMLNGQWSMVNGQITIGGKVYGGGNAGNLSGSTKVTVYAGDLNEVYGGARQADVGGHTFVNIEGQHASDDILIKAVYGGNDISGKIGETSETTDIPEELENKAQNPIDNTWKTFVRTSANDDDVSKAMVIGRLFGGGNGDYDYNSEFLNDGTTLNPYHGLTVPNLPKTYLELKGGCIAHVYGGGNNATVTEETVINIDNGSADLQRQAEAFKTRNGISTIDEVFAYLQTKVSLTTFQSNLTSYAFNFARVFGGNNKAEMTIQPKWNVQKGIIRDLYSGGNEGNMTCKDGLLLDINPAPANKDKLEITNVYGGCRRADVHPMNNGQDVIAYSPTGYKFPAGFSARTIVRGGKIHNVYGGNDISGKVHGGNAVGIYCDILGDVYGGGNGSYAYTDNFNLATNNEYKDFYYAPGSSSVEALTAFRPNAEQVSIRVAGAEDNPITICGSIYVGGNSATLTKDESKINNPDYPKYPIVELKIGSYVTADKVFLGNNGENMIDKSILAMYAGATDKVPEGYSTLELSKESDFAEYMKGCAMDMIPNVVFDSKAQNDPDDYIDYTSKFGSFYCGGNVGSMIGNGLTKIDFDKEVVIFDKFVGGCNNANVDEQTTEVTNGETTTTTVLNAAYEGGVTGTPDDDTGNKIVLNLKGLRIEPKRWKNEDNKLLGLEWNTWIGDTKNLLSSDATTGTSSEDDLNRRFKGGNIYGGCYSSGRVNGNVVINLNGTIVECGKKDDELEPGEKDNGIFDGVNEDKEGEAILYGHDNYTINKRRSGVILGQQGMDVLGKSLNVFGGGKGKDTEIWGSTTINLNAGYTFQIFGGSEEGVIGKSLEDLDVTVTENGEGTTQNYDYEFNGKHYAYSPAYSCYVNLKGDYAGVTKTSTENSPLMADCEFLYGGGFFGPICGNTVINLGKGRIFNSFAGSCMADILGHTETYIGRMVKDEYQNIMGKLGSTEGGLDNDMYYEEGFPWVRDITYGGNDLGGLIMGKKDFSSRVRNEVSGMVHNAAMLNASAYTEYLQGRADGIFGGCYGTYDYKELRFREFFDEYGTPKEGYNKPYMDNAFVNFRPTYHQANLQDPQVKQIFGAGQGADQLTDPLRDGDKLQNSSYVLIDIPSDLNYYNSTAVFGGGKFNGLGMAYNYKSTPVSGYETLPTGFQLDQASAIIDLARGEVGNVYGGSYNEGIVRRSVINVPTGSTINVNNIFGGGYGKDINIPCDVIEAQVNYKSDDATVRNNIYGGNNNADRTLYGQINITKPVWQNKSKGYLATIYGAGRGVDTWSQYTEVNLLAGAQVFEVYGGGENGQVVNTETLAKWSEDDPELVLDLHSYTDNGLDNPLAKTTALGGKYNTNVHIHKDALVVNYAYGGGLGDSEIPHSGDVYGTTYIDLLGGTVKKDIYAAGTTGSVQDGYEAKTFTASATAYIEGGSCRNLYGGGWEGSVGKHTKEVNQVEVQASISDPWTDDILGETHVVIGKFDGTSFLNGIPAVQRNVYGGGEGGPVFGTTNVIINNGYIGYSYNSDTGTYTEKVDDDTWTDHVGTGRLYDSGCVFGGGYIDNSNVDYTNVVMYGGYVRNSLFGGGEIAAVGRGECEETGEENKVRTLKGIYKGGSTFVDMFNGHVLRNVFGGGRGYDNLGNIGHLYTDGYVFGKTDVHVHGGEVGTVEGMENPDTRDKIGNVFGGGDVGYVYSAYEYKDNNGVAKLGRGMKSGKRYNDDLNPGDIGYDDEGYYYRANVDRKDAQGNIVPDYEHDALTNEKLLTEDCKVLIEPHCRVKSGSVPFTNIHYPKDAVMGKGDIQFLKNANPDRTDIDENGKVIAENGITFSRTYSEGDYVSAYALNTLKDKGSDASRWAALDDEGIIVHNAVFAGGNVTEGSDQIYANATTVFGNATASIHDVYHRDLITIGTGHTGGLYGDGNLTFVDGYRGLNITNYGTDYYNISMEISIDTYRSLPVREQAYYELRYSCLKECEDIDGKTYTPANGNIKASTITADELLVQFEGINTAEGTPMIVNGKPNSTYWKEEGVCSRYAGRIMNTIQRADFCGVFGSRMVMQGAQDRVPEEVDNTNYTINRVREVSLNKKLSVAGDTEEKHKMHGNYFGIYNIVNYLGALTSDVDFHSVRTTNNTESTYAPESSNQTFADWKGKYIKDRKRNNGTSHNQLALASGVYLELTTEKSWGKGVNEKDWGLITGVVELDLINVQAGIGGGFVYAKNEHGVRHPSNKKHVTLTALNRGAVTSDDFYYETNDNTKEEWETSGNFVHGTQVIIDDCYPESYRYKSDNAVPAHYWYIKGQVYIYDQYISAYTGAPSAYSRVEYIPLTITAASHGEMKLLNVMPNRYAYFSRNTSESSTKLTEEDEITIGEKTYKLNDPISYWDYNLLTPSEKRLFVEKTYVTVASCKIGDTVYPAGSVMLPSDYTSLKSSASSQTIDGEEVKAVKMLDLDENGNYVERKDENNENIYEAFDFVFRESNNMSHNGGYILTYDVTNPKIWDKWYTLAEGAANEKITTEAYKDLTDAQQKLYHNGPTYRPKTAGLYGQQEYSVADIIPETTYTTYQSLVTNNQVPATGQAKFEEAYIVTKEVAEATKKDGTKQHLFVGATVVKSDYFDNSDPEHVIDHWSELSGSVATAYVCTNTIKLGENNYIYINQVMSEADKNDYSSQVSDIDDLVKPAYYCTSAGFYGGDYYLTTKNYRGLEAWSSMSEADREKFTFNYDALDLLIDPTYSRAEGQKYQYDGNYTSEEAVKNETTGNKAGYSVTQPVDYTATYDGTSAMNYTDKSGTNRTVAVNQELSREQYESLPNEKRHYAPISVAKEGGTYYVVNEPFIHGETPYSVGQVVEAESYASLGSDQSHITTLTFDSDTEAKTYYYCRESYKVGHNGEGYAVEGTNKVTGADASGSYNTNAEVPIGLVITADNYSHLANRQLNFNIHGVAPIETSTLYVSRNSDIYDLSTEKIITVIYQYDYEESDEDGLHITPISERHIVNIHIKFESGIPEVENINKPKIILPGTQVSLRTPNVKPGAYEVTGGGWMLFEKFSDTESHTNGIEYTPTADPLYWYQNGYWVAYYAKTYLGKTFSNAVQVSVANYHDLHDVMSDKNKTHHMYVDHPKVLRDSKIYINDYSNLTDVTDPRKNQNGLDLLKDLFDLSVLSGSPAEGSTLEGHAPLNEHVRAGNNLEFFLRSDLDHSGKSWTPIGESTCFEGVLHGDGHTISGLTPNPSATTDEGKTGSLFSKLCGSVYNLGVTGSFTGGGVADTGSGYAENCWVKTTGTPAAGTKAIIGNPSRGSGTQIVNCYYPESNAAFDATDNGRGIARKMPDKTFYNGEVTYDLNGFYLYKRYYDNNKTWTGDKTPYNYLPTNDDGTLPNEANSANYPTSTFTFYQPVGVTAKPAPYLGYVESRYYDGDFQYAGGTIPEESDRRMRRATVSVLNQDNSTSLVETDVFYPIWPDDYLFFGQMLTYGHVDGRTHQENPSFYSTTNRVYRAPAYFRDSKMDVAHFNPDAVFSETKKGDASVIAYKGMTAIDFTGYNDVSQGYQRGVVTAAPYGKTLDGAFYPPLLDDDGLTSFKNVDLTRNLLVYTGTPGTSASGKTGTVVSDYLPDEAYVETDDDYHTVAPWDSPSDKVKGHWVEYDGADYTAPRDHVLVDKQDFNAPIGYTFDSDYRMWYQRLPGNYVGKKKPDGTFIANNAGWDAISLPFKAEIVTTDVKGEITHFYGGSWTSKNSAKKIGHEYWLREFTDITEETKDVNGKPISVGVATLTYPAANSTDGKKEYTNTFLWDYYYSHNSYHDLNADEYQEDDENHNYYKYGREYPNYPRLANGKAYIIGFPGERYYEFDLSGNFKAATAEATIPAKVEQQTITFASATGATIAISDSETGDVRLYKGNNYTFKPNYLNMEVDENGYVLNSEGNQYDRVTSSTATDAKTVLPFRPYFTVKPSSSREITRSIVFSGDGADMSHKRQDADDPGTLTVHAAKHKIVVTSTLKHTTDVRIMTTGGQTFATFSIKPGETIETRIQNAGVFIVQDEEGKYIKKLAVE